MQLLTDACVCAQGNNNVHIAPVYPVVSGDLVFLAHPESPTCGALAFPQVDFPALAVSA